MKLYRFEDLGAELSLMPLAARRAADRSGLRPSLEAWQSLSLADRLALAEAGSQPVVDAKTVRGVLSRARPEPAAHPSLPELSPEAPPGELVKALGEARPLPVAVWSALGPLDRYALDKLREKPERLQAAYREIVGVSAQASHLDPSGQARMVGITDKAPTLRRATAVSRIGMNAEAFARLERADAPKGDVLGTARLAGIQGAKRTSDLIPLCHPLALTRVDVELSPEPAARAVAIRATVEAHDRTGVEMEALTAASAAALTIYDMLKAFDRAMRIGPTQLVEKSGGRSGDYRAPAPVGGRERCRISETELSIDEVVSAVARAEAGAIVVFAGSVRSESAGKSVSALDYQAYASMALRELTGIIQEIEKEMPETRLSAVHRVGELRVGELAVVCAASAPHREAGFAACRKLIDRLKERVPIWKREHGPDGSFWVGWEDARTGSG